MTDRTQGILNRASDAEKFSGVRWILGDGVLTNYMQSFVDDTMKRNAEFQSRAGVSPKIVRKSPTKCCPWCDALVGTYNYPDDVPDDVYRRHDNCNCIVEFYPGDGRKQDVWSKQWDSAEVLEERKNIVGVETAPKVVTTSEVVANARSWGIPENEPAQLEKKLTSDEIIDRVGGGDLTSGSCSSLALTYAGNKAGFDVLDFRGGNSCDFFARSGNIKKIVKEANGTTLLEMSDFKSAEKLLESVEDGKEYYFTAGQHAAVVRRTGDGLEYLELQSGEEDGNGWKELNKDVLKRRFGCKRSHSTYGIKYGVESTIVDIDNLKNYDAFEELLGFINTAEDAQKKGVWGTIK